MGISVGGSFPKSHNGKAGEGSTQWESAPKIFTRRSGVVCEFWGPTGTGRTRLALTAPGPIAYIYFHEKVDGMVQQFSNEKEIRMFKAGGVFRGESDEIQRDAWQKMLEYEAAYYDSFSFARTTIVDTHNEAWMLERLAEFGAPKPSKGQVKNNYGSVNNRWMSMLNMARTQDKTNVIFIGQAEDEWKPNAQGFDSKTGRIVRKSDSASNQVLLKSDVAAKTDKINGDFISTITKGWWNADSEDSYLKNQSSTFSMLMGLVTDTDPSEWE
jgi:hypothetical protein